MPPRYAYWTIVIDAVPTAFRAREREELLPALKQLSRTSPNAHLGWFAHGRLWSSPEDARSWRRHSDIEARGRRRPPPRGRKRGQGR